MQHSPATIRGRC